MKPNQGNPSSDSSTTGPSRRSFLAGATAAGVGVWAGTTAAEDNTGPNQSVNIAIVGCGGRGTGAVSDNLTINKNARIVAAADIDERKLQSLKRRVDGSFGDQAKIDEKSLHAGLDAYQKVLDDKNVDLVLFATPPGFRPYHITDAVKAGKHVFAEKPSCVDPAGYRVCVEAHEAAEKAGTSIVTGTQYRRQSNYIAAVEKIREGAIGDIVSAQTRYCSGGIWYRTRQEGMSDTRYQIYNWMHFVWLSGDQIAEQAVHNIDALNWVMGGPPETAYGSGGRFTRPDDSEMWDNMAIDYVYPGNRLLSFMCRQLPRSASDNGNIIFGSEATCYISAMSGGSRIVDRDGKEVWKATGSIRDAYRQEHKDLVDSIVKAKPIVELKQTAESSLTAVMGRLAAYTGQRVTWDFVTNKSTLDLFPKDLDLDGARPEWTYAKPGTTKLV